MRPELLNGANLAFIGDAYYELYIRRYLIEKNITKGNDLNKQSIKYVSATAHNKITNKLQDIFTDEENSIFKRGRNHKYNISRKNLKREEYLNSSGYEALIGYLYLKEDFERLEFLLKKSIQIIEKDEDYE